MQQYLGLLQHILDTGTQKHDRTGTGIGYHQEGAYEKYNS